MPPNAYGRADVTRVPAADLRLAQAFRRTPGSPGSKTPGLDGSGEHVARDEVELPGRNETGSRKIEQALQEPWARMAAVRHGAGVGEEVTTRLGERRVPLGRHRFALATPDGQEHDCGCCGLRPGDLEGGRLLLACPIHP